jgi:hypothetical protein
MKIQRLTLIKLAVAAAAVCIAIVSVLPILTRTRSKVAAIESPPGPLTALRQIYVATLKYSQIHGKAPSNMNDLNGIMVPPSKGAFVPFSKEALSRELGSRASSVAYFPEFLALSSMFTNDPIVLAYISDSNSVSSNVVLELNGKIRLMDSNQIQQRIAELESAVGTGKTQ